MLSRVVDNIYCYNLDNGDILRKVIVKIGLERIDTQEGMMVEALLDSRAMRLVMSSEFARNQRFKLKKIKNLIYVRNVDGTFNKEELIENVILGMPQLACYNPKINWRTREVKMIRCPEEYERQQRSKQGKVGWQKYKKEEKKKEVERKQEEKQKK